MAQPGPGDPLLRGSIGAVGVGRDPALLGRDAARVVEVGHASGVPPWEKVTAAAVTRPRLVTTLRTPGCVPTPQ